ncbi:MAG: hypothetical protein WCO98_02120 [bacterium]
MIEFTHTQLLKGDYLEGLTERQQILADYCEWIARDCVEAVDGDDTYFDALRFCIIDDKNDLLSGGKISEFLSTDDDPLQTVIDRAEECQTLFHLQAYLLVMSISDVSADYLVIPSEIIPKDWLQAIAVKSATWGQSNE